MTAHFFPAVPPARTLVNFVLFSAAGFLFPATLFRVGGGGGLVGCIYVCCACCKQAVSKEYTVLLPPSN